MAKETSVQCMSKNCERWSAARGVCYRCYSTLYYRVKVGLTTWARAMNDGKILPNKSPNKR